MVIAGARSSSPGAGLGFGCGAVGGTALCENSRPELARGSAVARSRAGTAGSAEGGRLSRGDPGMQTEEGRAAGGRPGTAAGGRRGPGWLRGWVPHGRRLVS